MNPFLSDWYRDDPFGFVVSAVVSVVVVLCLIGIIVVAVKIAMEVVR